MKLFLRNLQKIILQYCILPIVYWWYKSTPIDDNLVLFADSKHDGIPYSLKAMYDEVNKRGYSIVVYCHNYSKLKAVGKLKDTISFMKLYARAKYVFICDYYLPVSSCNKKNETKVVQLWHASGLQKKFGFDAKDDLGNMKFLNPVKNYDLVSVSSEIMIPVISQNWRMPEYKIKALGTSRTDIFFDKVYLKSCKEKFYRLYPKAKNKKIILWAPSFRGNGSDATIIGLDEMLNLQSQLGDEYYVIIKLHPHLQGKYNIENCDLSTEELYSVTDLLITDYSSVFYDYLLFNSNVIFYVPDYLEYTEQRGMYIDYNIEFKFPIVKDVNELYHEILNYIAINTNELDKYKTKYIQKNDGEASRKIMKYLEESING